MPKKILMIEDELPILDTTLEFLGAEGFEVLGAENGQIGLEMAREQLPDLIICDIMMPVLDGHGVLAELRKDPTTAAIPFIFLTAQSDRSKVRLGMEMGADDYLPKPFSVTELLAAAETRLEKRSVVAEAADRKLDSLRETLILTLPHELRTPLTSILGYAELLEIDAENVDPKTIRQMSGTIVKSGQRLYRLIENYLAFAQLEITKTNPVWIQALRSNRTANPQIFVRDRATIKAKQHGREADIVVSSEEVPPIKIAEHYLIKIVQELADNAFKFSRTGTSVYVYAAVDNNQCILRFTNKGRGMTREQIINVGAYVQFERKIHEQQGSGLGLIITKRLAELHGGELIIESVPGEQTTVSVSLPLAEDTA